MLRVKLFDGQFNPVTVVRLQVGRAGETPAHSHHGRGGFHVPGKFMGGRPQGFGGDHFLHINSPEPKGKLDAFTLYGNHLFRQFL